MPLKPKDLKDALRETVVEKAAELGERALEKLSHKAGKPPAPAELSAEPAFTSSIPWSIEIKAKSLVILCSDARFVSQSEDFVANALQVADYDIVALPGGVQWLALPDVLPKHHKVAKWMTRFMITKHHLDRVICIAHEDCGAYQDSKSLASLAFLVTGKSVQQHQLDHLRVVGRRLTQWFGVAAELYYAAVEEGSVAFHKVE